MVKIVIPEEEAWDEARQEFISHPSYILEFEHSLETVAKWESKHRKAFLSKKEKTVEEVEDYIRCMLVDESQVKALSYLTNDNIKTLQEYIDAPMTAVYFNDDSKKKGPNGDTITADLIYYWMISLNIPFECQKWHLNRLMALIRVCSIKNAPPKKMSKKEIMSRNAALNEARRKQLHTRG